MTLLDPSRHDIYGIPAAELARADLSTAVELLWEGWEVVYTHPFRTTTGDCAAAVIMSRRALTVGWAATIVRTGSHPSVQDAVDRFCAVEAVEKRRGLIHNINNSIIGSESNLIDFGFAVHQWLPKFEATDDRWPAYYFQWYWTALLAMPCDPTFDADIETAKTMWSLADTGTHNRNL